VLGLEVKGSMIPGAGFGLFVTRDFFPGVGSPMYLDCCYDGTSIDLNTYNECMLNADVEERKEFESRYLFAVTNDGPFIDGTRGGSILRYINNTTSSRLVNCKFVRTGVPGNYRLKVQITANVSKGCELLLVYNNLETGCEYMKNTNETEAAIEQRIAILKSYQ
jgi:hypothetical protein